MGIFSRRTDKSPEEIGPEELAKTPEFPDRISELHNLMRSMDLDITHAGVADKLRDLSAIVVDTALSVASKLTIGTSMDLDIVTSGLFNSLEAMNNGPNKVKLEDELRKTILLPSTGEGSEYADSHSPRGLLEVASRIVRDSSVADQESAVQSNNISCYALDIIPELYRNTSPAVTGQESMSLTPPPDLLDKIEARFQPYTP